MPDMPKNTATTIDEFNQQARSYVAKAKASGASNTAMAGMIQFMYGQDLADEKNKITPLQQAELDIKKEQLNQLKSGEIRTIKDAYGNEKLVRIKSDGTV